MNKRVTVIAGISFLAAVIGAAVLADLQGSSDEALPPSDHAGDGAQALADGTPDEPGYPAGWEVGDLDSARDVAKFTLIDPPASLTEVQTITHVFVFPDDVAVAVDFAPQTQDTATRQNYIEIYETTWSGGDPAKVFAETVESTPYDDDEAFNLNGVPTMSVKPNSSGDAEEANPAYVEFVVKGVQVQISGGSDLDALLSIAKSMIDSASAP